MSTGAATAAQIPVWITCVVQTYIFEEKGNPIVNATSYSFAHFFSYLLNLWVFHISHSPFLLCLTPEWETLPMDYNFLLPCSTTIQIVSTNCWYLSWNLFTTLAFSYTFQKVWISMTFSLGSKVIRECIELGTRCSHNSPLILINTQSWKYQGTESQMRQ